MRNGNFDTEGFTFVMKFFVIAFALFGLANGNFLLNHISDGNGDYMDILDERISEIRENNMAQIASIDHKNTPIVFGFVGDIMLDRNVERMILTEGKGDFNFPFFYIGDRLRSYDFLFGNLEGAVSDKGQDQGSLYSFRMDTKALRALKNAGFDILSVANNHSADWGSEAMYDTLRRLEGVGLRYIGGGFNVLNAYRPKIIDINGTKIAYLAFSQFESGRLEGNITLARIDEDILTQAVSSVLDEVDIIIVSFHFGDEYESLPNDYQKNIARLAIDSGADLVVGHHPHVVQPVERYKNGYIAYSLGNFVFDQDFSEETMHGILLEATVQDGEIIEVDGIPFQMNKYFQPTFE